MNEKFTKLITESGLTQDHISAFSSNIETLIQTVIEECAVVAEQHSRTYSDGDAGSGAKGAANAVRCYSKTLFDK